MRTAIAGLLGALVGITLEGLLLPHFQPFLTPVLPAISEAIQSTIASQDEAARNRAIYYAASGYREPGDVLLTFISLLLLFGGLIVVVICFARLRRSSESPRNRHVIDAFAILAVLGFGYLVYVDTTDLGFCQLSRQLGFFRLARYTHPFERRG